MTLACVASSSRNLHTSRLVIPDRALAGGRFGGFKPSDEGPWQVRQQLVTGDELQQLRQRRQMLKDMTPEQAYHAIEWVRANLTFFEAVALAKQKGKLMVPNLVIDRILAETSYALPPIRTGTLIIYEKPDKPFGAKVVYENIKFSVPKPFQGKVNCALMVEYPDFGLTTTGNSSHQLIVQDESKIYLSESFPQERD